MGRQRVVALPAIQSTMGVDDVRGELVHDGGSLRFPPSLGARTVAPSYPRRSRLARRGLLERHCLRSACSAGLRAVEQDSHRPRATGITGIVDAHFRPPCAFRRQTLNAHVAVALARIWIRGVSGGGAGGNTARQPQSIRRCGDEAVYRRIRDAPGGRGQAMLRRWLPRRRRAAPADRTALPACRLRRSPRPEAARRIQKGAGGGEGQRVQPDRGEQIDQRLADHRIVIDDEDLAFGSARCGPYSARSLATCLGAIFDGIVPNRAVT